MSLDPTDEQRRWRGPDREHVQDFARPRAGTLDHECSLKGAVHETAAPRRSMGLTLPRFRRRVGIGEGTHGVNRRIIARGPLEQVEAKRKMVAR